MLTLSPLGSQLSAIAQSSLPSAVPECGGSVFQLAAIWEEPSSVPRINPDGVNHQMSSGRGQLIEDAEGNSEEGVKPTSITSTPSSSIQIGSTAEWVDPVLVTLELRQRNIDKSITECNIRRKLIEDILVRRRAIQSTNEHLLDFGELLTAFENENEAQIKELDSRISECPAGMSSLTEQQEVKAILDACQVRKHELSYLRSTGVINDTIAHYRHTCSELDGLECYASTQMQIREELCGWALDIHSKHQVRWLVGDMGMGKTTLCRSIAIDLEARGSLLASYFLHDKCVSLAFLPKSIASGLAHLDPDYDAQVQGDYDVSPEGRSLSALTESYVDALKGKLVNRRWKRKTRAVVIVDGLDYGHIEEVAILAFVVKAFSELNIPIAWIFSSTYKSNIAHALSEFIPGRCDNFMIDLNHSTEERDGNIRCYANARLQELFTRQKLVGDSELLSQAVNYMVESSGGQFSFVDVLLTNTPPHDLSILLRGDPLALARACKPLDDRYKSLLEASWALVSRVSYDSKDDRRTAFFLGYGFDTVIQVHEHSLSLILYYILYLDLPKTCLGIAFFWGYDVAYVNRLVKDLHPVLRVSKQNEPIEINLASFRTFLTTPERSGKYAILKPDFDLLAIRRSIHLVNNFPEGKDYHPSSSSHGMYSLWSVLAEENDELESKYPFELVRALERLNPSAWEGFCSEAGVNPNKGHEVLRKRLGMWYRVCTIVSRSRLIVFISFGLDKRCLKSGEELVEA
ncbi:hypothetical protein AX16_008369 [Volvariella volvacea WC 439]|nr:hypothetical protein AX16_008369 [Volvariella volvacea WC 439]